MNRTRTTLAASLAALALVSTLAHAKGPGWSATTQEAAASDENKKVLAKGRATSVTGEIIDVSCYAQLGKRGEAHVACGTKCLQHGEPVGIVDDKGQVYVLMAEQHHPRRDGEVSIRDVYVPQLSKRVTVSGVLSTNGGVRALFVPVGADTTSQAAPADADYYTCEMHPDVHASGPGTCPKCGMSLQLVSKKK